MRIKPEQLLFVTFFFASVSADFGTRIKVDMHVDVEIKLYPHVDLKKTCQPRP